MWINRLEAGSVETKKLAVIGPPLRPLEQSVVTVGRGLLTAGLSGVASGRQEAAVLTA